MKLMASFIVGMMLCCSSCYMIHEKGKTKLGPGNHAGFAAAALATGIGGSIRIAAAFGEVDDINTLRSAEFLLLGGILTGLVTTYISLIYFETPEAKKEPVMVPLDSILEHLKKNSDTFATNADDPPKVKTKQAPPLVKKQAPPPPKPAAPIALVDCPKGSSVEGVPPPKGFEQYCVNMETGVREGPFCSWFGVDKKASEGAYKNGKQHGKWRFWHSTGQIRLEAEYGFGTATGTWIWYDKKGKTTKTQTQ